MTLPNCPPPRCSRCGSDDHDSDNCVGVGSSKSQPWVTLWMDAADHVRVTFHATKDEADFDLVECSACNYEAYAVPTDELWAFVKRWRPA